MTFIDTHAHLYEEKFKDIQAVIARALEANVKHFFIPNVDKTSIDGMLSLEEKFESCKPMMGLHPCYVKKDFEKELYIIESWLNQRKFWGIGEIGLDLHWDKTFYEEQKEAFSIQMEWAKKFKIPIAIHSREANDEAIKMVEKHKDDNLRGIFHCFGGSVAQAEKMIQLGFYLGIGGVVTYKNGGLDAVLPHISLDNLVLETDCPYLAPIPHRGKTNECSFIPLIAQKIAEIKGVSIEEVAEKTTQNAQKLFGF